MVREKTPNTALAVGISKMPNPRQRPLILINTQIPRFVGAGLPALRRWIDAMF